MSDPVLDQALTILNNQERRGRSPNLALLGPPGSGKSQFLTKLFSTIENDERFGDTKCLMIDLSSVPVRSQNEIYSHLNHLLLQEASRAGIPQDFNIKVQYSHLRFNMILKHLLGEVKGYLIIFIDHLESVPRLFSSDLSHWLRKSLEASEPDSAYQRLGLIVAGAVSLYDLKHGENSAFQMLDIISFPSLDPAFRKLRVEEYLKTYMARELPGEIVDFLVKLTGGEPGFIEPLMMHLLRGPQQIDLSEELITNAVDEICAQASNPILRSLALQIWGDQDLRDIVRDLNRLTRVEPRSAIPDIDRFQLSGAVVVDHGPFNQSQEYQFRNEITARFLTRLNDYLRDDVTETAKELLIASDLAKLESAKTNCLNAESIWTWVDQLETIWEVILRYKSPNICLFLTQNGLSSGWWFDAKARKVTGAEPRELSPRSPKASAYSALDNISIAFSDDSDSIKAFVESDPETISIGLPLCAREVTVILVATVSRMDAGRRFTEFDLSHWIRFLQNVKQVVPRLVLAELGQRLISEMHTENQTRQSPGERQIRRDRRADSKFIYLLPKSEALIKDSRAIAIAAAEIPQDTIEDLNKRCFDLVDERTSNKAFEEKLAFIGNQMAKTFRTETPELVRHLESDTREFIISSSQAGLKIPFELFPRERRYLATFVSLARQIIGYTLPQNVAHDFDYLLRVLARDNEQLRVLLIASEAGGEMALGRKEIRQVREHIEAGCERIKVKPHFTEIPPEAATTQRVEHELIHNRPYQLFHYSGHGMHFSEDPNASGLVLLDEDDLEEVVSCRRLSRWLEGAGVWLAYLSCCQSSSASGGEVGPTEKYVGTLDAVASAGVPNIVGFRWLVSDQSAFHLADEFYRQLFEVQSEKNLSLAMLEARRAVERRPDFFDAWASSMLITQYC